MPHQCVITYYSIVYEQASKFFQIQILYDTQRRDNRIGVDSTSCVRSMLTLCLFKAAPSGYFEVSNLLAILSLIVGQ